MAIVDRIIVLEFGKIIAVGTPEEVVKNREVTEAYIGKEVSDLVSRGERFDGPLRQGNGIE
jgi:ABC-type hemin transport system ATPase subunit